MGGVLTCDEYLWCQVELRGGCELSDDFSCEEDKCDVAVLLSSMA